MCASTSPLGHPNEQSSSLYPVFTSDSLFLLLSQSSIPGSDSALPMKLLSGMCTSDWYLCLRCLFCVPYFFWLDPIRFCPPSWQIDGINLPSSSHCLLSMPFGGALPYCLWALANETVRNNTQAEAYQALEGLCFLFCSSAFIMRKCLNQLLENNAYEKRGARAA